jgi:predicted glutamine amidotransferase
MCVIVNKNRGIELPRKELLENCFSNNSDGCGMMYNLNGKVYIEKGFMKFDEFYNRLMELDEKINLVDRGLVMHFRISTSGGINKGNCHPYPISNDVNDLKALKFTTDLGMAHNGIMSKYEPSKDSTLNDTQTFIKTYLSNVYEVYKDFLKDDVMMKAIEYEVGSKLSFLDTEGNITTVGKFEEYEGCQYSNSTYSYNYYSSSYWAKWSSWSSLSSASEILELDEDDLTSLSGKPLSLEEFCDVLDVVYIPADNTRMEVNGKEIICNGNYCLDMSNNLYEIDYVSYQINYLGMAYGDEEKLETEHPTEEDYEGYDWLDEYEEFYEMYLNQDNGGYSESYPF